jgi:hypothetical protein
MLLSKFPEKSRRQWVLDRTSVLLSLNQLSRLSKASPGASKSFLEFLQIFLIGTMVYYIK